MVAIRAPLLEPDAPGWAARLVLRLQSIFLPVEPAAPIKLKAYPSTSLPDPAAWRGCVIYVEDEEKIGLSNGTAWTDAIGGAL